MLSVHSGHSVAYLTDQVAAGREGYYTGAVAAGEPAGRWSGAGAEVLGLSGEVDAEQMAAVYLHLLDPRDPASATMSTWGLAQTLGEPHKTYRSAKDIYAVALAGEPGATPERRAELRAEADRSARAPVAFIDCTFNAPKSVTLYAVACERAAQEARERGDLPAAAHWQGKVTAVEDAVRAGAAAGLAYLQQHAGLAKAGHHGGGAGRWVDAGGWVIASFLQHDSRDHDPHLHIHNAVLNRQLCADGKWRALDSMAIRREKPAAGALAERVMEAHLARSLEVVVETRADGKAREIVGVSQRLRDQFSKRTRAITPKAAKLVAAFVDRNGRDPAPAELFKIMRQATLSTRAAKTHTAETVGERLDRWQGEALTETRGGLAEVLAAVAAGAAAHAGIPTWSPRDVCERAVALAADRKAAWTRADLFRAVSDSLPGQLGVAPEQVTALLAGLTDRALEGAVRLSAPEPTDELAEHLLRADGSSMYDSGQVFYAAPWQLAAERALLRRADATGVETFTAAEVDQVIAAAERGGRTLGADQAAAVTGILTSGRALEVIQAPAGAGKSWVVGVLAEAWTDQTVAPHAGGPRRVFGLATSQNAANVLAGEGLSATANITAWRGAQARLDAGRPTGDDEAFRLHADDLLIVDEAGMVDTAHLAEIDRRCGQAGAKLLLTGDTSQLGAIGAGGGLADLAGRARTYELTEVRRFDAEWEAAASLRLRDGDPAVVAEYAKHGRIVTGGTAEQTEAAAARAWLADHLAGRDTVLLAPSNEAVARLNAALRAELARVGRVDEQGVAIGGLGEVAGAGDLVAARRNGRPLADMFAGHPDPPVNRDLYRVLGIRDDGGLDVARVLGRRAGDAEQLGAPTVLPAAYVAEHLSLGYAATVHSVQGRTTDTAHALVAGGGDPAGTYVAMSRGRAANTAYCVTTVVAADNPTGAAQDAPRRAGTAVFADAIARDGHTTDGRSATATMDESGAQAASVATQLDRLAVEVAEATAGRTSATLDMLAATGALHESHRVAMAADGAAMGQLDRLLRTAELAGHDPATLLTGALAERSLDGAHTPAGALYSRISRAHAVDLDPRMTGYTGLVPAAVDEATRARLTGLAEAADDRRRELGAQVSAEPPVWATRALGPVPDDVFAAADWEHAAGWAAAYRELSGWADDTAPLGPSPAPGRAEHRAAWRVAHAALDLPDARREEAEMSDGQHRVRIVAADRERSWLPARVAETMEATALARERAGQDTVHYRAHAAVADNTAEADALAADADRAAAEAYRLAGLHDQLGDVDAARGACLADIAVTLDHGERSRIALAMRGVDPDAADDRTKGELWLAEERRARAADDAHRPVYEHDVDHRPDWVADLTDDDGPVLETAVPDIRERTVRDASEDADPAELRRVASEADVAAQRARMVDADLERAARRGAEAREDARLERERCWHQDDQAAEDVAAAEHGDVMVLER